MTYHSPLRYIAAVLAMFTAYCAVGQEVDEIVVTADFRGRAESELAASVTVFDAAQIEQRAVQHFEELIFSVPNLNWSGDGHRARYFQIRGAGELEQYQGAPNPSVGFLIDDIDFSGIGSVATLFDIQQVDVLRGPQGTRYGANALAGLIYMQSTMPHADWSGKVHLSAGNDEAYAAGLAFGGALDDTDTILLRMSLHQYQSNGFRDNPYLRRDDSNGRDELTARLRLTWLPNELWQINVATLLADVDNGYDAFALDNSYTVLSDKPGRDAQRSLGASLKVEYSGWPGVDLVAISALANSDIVFSYDADWGNTESWAPVTYDYISVSDRKRQTLSQEFRFIGDRWLAGIYAMRLRDELDTLDQGEYYDPFYDFADSLDSTFGSDYEATSIAAFGQLDFDFSDATRLSAGLRVERRSTRYRDSDDLRASPSEAMVGGELTLSHEHSSTMSSFLTLSRGYKAGGFNLGAVPGDRREFGAEAMWNLEAGVKSRWRDDSLRLSASVFHARRDDQQVRTSFQIDPGDPTSFIFYTDNAARGDTLGVEAELRWLPSDAWDVYATVGLLDATFNRFVTPQVKLNGRDQAHAPASGLSLGARFSHPSGFFARLDVTARDRFFFDVSHNEKSQAYELVNARVGFETGMWSIQAWARNVFDQDYAVRGFYFGNEPPDFPPTLYTRWGDPRQLGLSIEVNF